VLSVFDILCCRLIVTSNIRYEIAVEKIEFGEFLAKVDILCILTSNLGVRFSNLATNRYILGHISHLNSTLGAVVSQLHK
jgi:hypothetical protein